MLHVVERDRRVGKDDPLGARVRDVPLVPEGDVLESGLRVPAKDAGEAGDPLGRDRVSLVGHCRRALLALAEGLLGLADLGPLEVSDLGCEALEPSARERDRREQRRVAVARHDLGRGILGPDAERVANVPLDLWRNGCVGADRAGDGADRGIGERRLEPFQVAVGLECEAGEAEAEGGRLGVDAVRAPDAERVRVLDAPVRPGRRGTRGRPRRRSRPRRGSAGRARCRGRRTR